MRLPPPSPPQLKSITISFILSVPAGTKQGQEVFQELLPPITGRIAQIVLFFPAGAQGTTGVFLTVEGKQEFPYKDGSYIALDNATIPFFADIEVHRGDKVRLNGFNTDTVNAHTITAIITILTVAE